MLYLIKNYLYFFSFSFFILLILNNSSPGAPYNWILFNCINAASSLVKYNTNSDIFLNLGIFNPILFPNFPSNFIVSVAEFAAASAKSKFEELAKIFNIYLVYYLNFQVWNQLEFL